MDRDALGEVVRFDRPVAEALGQQDLKDVQHEHIYELTIDGRSLAGKPLNTQKSSSAQEDMGARMEQRINAFVEGQIESAMDKFLKKGQRE